MVRLAVSSRGPAIHNPWGNPLSNVLNGAKEVGVGRGLGQRPSRFHSLLPALA